MSGFTSSRGGLVSEDVVHHGVYDGLVIMRELCMIEVFYRLKNQLLFYLGFAQSWKFCDAKADLFR